MRQRICVGLLALLLALTACGSGEKDKLSELAFVAAPNYIAQDLRLPEDTGELFGGCTDGSSLWYLMAAEGENTARLYRADLAGGAVEALRDYIPPEAPEDAVFRRYGPVLAPDGTLWVYEEWRIAHYDLPEDFDPEADPKGSYFTGQEEFLHLRQLDPATGREEKLVDLSEAARALELGKTFGAVDFAVDGEDRVYLAGPDGVAVLDSQGKLLFTLESEASDTGMTGGLLALLPDGRVAAAAVRGGKRAVRPIDAEARDWAEDAYPLPGGAWAVFAGREPCLFYYMMDGVLYGAVAGEPIPQRLLPLENTRLEGYSGTECFALLDGGRLALLLRRVPGSGRLDESQIRLVLLTPTDQLPEDGKIKLVYGDLGVNSDAKRRIERFNASSDAYYIEYRDYTEGARELAEGAGELTAVLDAARLRLAGEIAAGRAPDIMSSALPLDSYARAGYLEDLWPWIDGDGELGREALMSHVLDCASADGKLYTIGSSFTIETAASSQAAAGARTGWTLEEMMDAYGGAMPAIYRGVTDTPLLLFLRHNADSMLRALLSMDLDRYVDWSSGTCRFDGEDFRNVLRLCTSAGTGEAYEAVFPELWEGGPALCQVQLKTVRDLVAWDVMFGGPETLSPETYEQTLWDAGVLYTFVSPYNGREVTNYSNCPSSVGEMMARRFPYPAAADVVTGTPDGRLCAAFPGFPSGGGAGSSFTLCDRVAVSAASQVKEGAWAFVRTLLLPGGSLRTDSWQGMDFSSYPGFPINRAELEELLEPRWCREDQDGEIILDQDGQPIEAAGGQLILIGEPVAVAAYQFAPNQAQLDRFWDLYNAIDHTSGENRTLVDLIAEQAQPYFAGDKSLAETAKLIQNRATLYINEN